MAYGVGEYGTAEYGIMEQLEPVVPPSGRTTKNTRSTVNIHPGVAFQTIIASQGI